MKVIKFWIVTKYPSFFHYFISLQDEVCKLQTALGVANDEVSQSMKLYNMSEIEKLRTDKEKYKQEAAQLKQVDRVYWQERGHVGGVVNAYLQHFPCSKHDLENNTWFSSVMYWRNKYNQ